VTLWVCLDLRRGQEEPAANAAGFRQPSAREQIVDSLALAAQVIGRLRDRHVGGSFSLWTW